MNGYKDYREETELNSIGYDVMEKEFPQLVDSDVRVAFLYCAKAKKSGKSTVYGECIKVRDIDKVFSPYDFYIVIYEPNIENFNDKQLRILVEHELMHIGVDDESDLPKYFIEKHDFEDFKNIINKYGADWSEYGRA